MPVLTPQQTDGAQDAAAPPSPPADRAFNWKPVIAIVAGVVVIAAVGFGIAAALGGDGDGSDTTEQATIRAVQAEQRDLAEFDELDGTLGFGEAVAHSPSMDGTITAIAEEGEVLERGDVAYEINGQPVVVLYGDTPLFRTLTATDEAGNPVGDGADIQTLEENLVYLGYDEAGVVEVNESFDEITTTELINSWKTDLGLPADGTVAPSMVLVTDGPVIVTDVAAGVGSGARVGTPIISYATTGETTSVFAGDTGRLTLVPSVGQTFSTGDVVYELDTEPVVAIVGNEPMTRELSEGVAEGEDVQQLEEALLALGYDADGELEVDEEFDAATTEALIEWQDDLGVDADGVFRPADAVVVPAGFAVLAVEVERGDDVSANDPLFELGASTRVVTTEIAVADQDRLGVGDVIEVEFPDGERAAGVVSDIGLTSSVDPADPDADPVLPVTIELDSVPESVSSLSEVDVDVLVARQLAEAATVVPASALIDAGNGQFAVEVVNADGATTSFVAVETGLFADGFVEVSGIDAGTAVVVPS